MPLFVTLGSRELSVEDRQHSWITLDGVHRHAALEQLTGQLTSAGTEIDNRPRIAA